MNLLVTGGCGFLGSNVAAEGIRRGMDVTVFDNLYRAGSVENLAWLRGLGRMAFIHGDIRNSNDVSSTIRQVQPAAVFHLAGQVAMTTSLRDPRMDFEVNAAGSHNLLEAVRVQCPMAAVLYSSTNKVYGDLEQFSYTETPSRFECVERPRGFDESTPLSFHSPYGCSKGAADQYMLDYARIFGLKTVVFRHSSIYGGRQRPTVDQGWVAWFAKQASEMKGSPGLRKMTISGSGKQVRDLLHASDATRLYFAALERIDRLGGQVFNIGGGIENSMSLLELFALLRELCGIEFEVERLPPRESDQRFFVADLGKALGAMNWRPEVGARQGVLGLLQGYREGGG